MKLLVIISILALVFGSTFLLQSYAEPNTITKYCTNGTCQTPNISNTITPGGYIAPPNYQKIGIQLSQSCINLERAHLKSNCLTYDKLIQFDTSKLSFSGLWTNQTYFHRLPSHLKNAYNFPQTTLTIMVDPDSSFVKNAKMIIIQSDNFTYTNPDEAISKNHTRNEYHNRFVSGCSEAIIAPNINLVNDTITYFNSNCTVTNYNTKITHQIKETPFSFNNPYSSLHYKDMLNQIKKTGYGNCITKQCVNITLGKKW